MLSTNNGAFNREIESSDNEDQFNGFEDDAPSGDEPMQDEEIASEPSSEDEEPATQRPYNSLLQLLNTKSETSHARKRRKLNHAGNTQESTSREVEVQETTEELEQDVLENQEASDEEDNVEVGKADEADDEDEDEDGKAM